MSAEPGTEARAVEAYSRLEVRMGTFELCFHVLVSVTALMGAATLAIGSLRGGVVAWPLVGLIAGVGVILATWTLRAYFGRPVLVLDSIGVEQVLVGTVRWQDVESMRKTERRHLLSAHTHTVLELRLRPGSRVLERPIWRRPFPSPRRVSVRIEGLEFEPGRIRAVAAALLSEGTWHTSLQDDAYDQLSRGTDPLIAELQIKVTRNAGMDVARLAHIGPELESAVAAHKAEAERGLDSRRHQGRVVRAFAPAATAIVAAGFLGWLWF